MACGIEALLRKAAADPSFRIQLPEKRAGAAAAIGLDLLPAEKAMLSAIPAEMLARTIDQTKVERRRRFLAKCAVGMLATAAVGVYWARREPSYKGKSLSEWLRLGEQVSWDYRLRPIMTAGLVNDADILPVPPGRLPPKPEMAEVETAIKAMGPVAIPVMVRMLKSRDSSLKVKVMTWLAKHQVVKFNLTPAARYQRRALIGLTVLGPQATNAVPAIQQFLADPNTAGDWQLQAFATEALETITGKQAPKSRPSVEILE